MHRSALRRATRASCRGLCLVLAGLAGTLVACGDDVGPGPRQDIGNLLGDLPPNACGSCQGCCQGGTQCLSGVTISACGIGGLTCQICNPTDACVNGTCIPASPNCGAANCKNGCCSSAGACVQPANDAACGNAGSPCKQCQTGEACSPAGVCESTKPKTYAVTLVSASVKNSDCGLGDNCDVFAEVSLGGGAVVKTPTITSENPLWDFKLFDAAEKALLTSKLKAVVIDDDGLLNPNDTLGTCEISITQAALATGELITSCGPMVKKLKFSFKLVP